MSNDPRKALAKGRADLNTIRANLAQKRAEDEALATKIASATKAGDVEAPIVEWTRERRKLGAEREDLEAEAAVLATFVEAREIEVAGEQAQALIASAEELKAEAHGSAMELLEALDSITPKIAAVQQGNEKYFLAQARARSAAEKGAVECSLSAHAIPFHRDLVNWAQEIGKIADQIRRHFDG